MSGIESRSDELMYSNPNRHLSDSQPWFVGSESTPRNRSTSFWLACTVILSPAVQCRHVDSTADKSHGRARNRYAEAVRAPTGQIWTVLPEKYDENGRSGKVAMWVTFARSRNSMSGSPDISSENRV